jgi:hypothetical protein
VNPMHGPSGEGASERHTPLPRMTNAINATFRWVGNRVGDVSNRTYELAAWLDRVSGWIYHQRVR